MQKKEEKGIITIVAILAIGIFSLGTSLLLARNVLQQTVANRNNISTSQAFYTAEGGAGEGIYNFRNDLSYRDKNETIFGINGLSANIYAGHLVNGYATIIGESTNKNNRRKIEVILRNFPNNKAFAFDYGLYTPQIINANGSVLVDGNVFAEEEFYCKGKEENDKCLCKKTPEDANKCIDGKIVEDESAVIPDFDFTDYQNQTVKNLCEAQNYLEGKTVDDILYINDEDCTKGEKTPNRVLNNLNFTGALYIKGDIKITGGEITAYENYLALVVEGNLELGGGITINGIVYVTGTTTFGAGGTTINGSLISLSPIIVNGDLSVYFTPSILNNWQSLVGLKDDSLYDLDFKPEFESWNEE